LKAEIAACAERNLWSEPWALNFCCSVLVIESPDASSQRDYWPASLNPALGEKLLDLANAQREAEIEPHRITDHVRRELDGSER